LFQTRRIKKMLFATLLPGLLLSHRYQLCNFSCPGVGEGATTEAWMACRAEKCTPRLPEDACATGSDDAKLIGPDGEAAAEEGIAVSGPQECEALWTDSSIPPFRPGSFVERCDLCMAVVGAAIQLWEEAAADPARGVAAYSGGSEGLEVSDEEAASAGLCMEAAAQMHSMLPTIRTCRLHELACAAVVDAARERACPDTWRMLRSGSNAVSTIRAAQQQTCGALMTQRNGSGIDDALVCPLPRDVGGRVMAIAFVVAGAIFAAQWARV
jgi:hypothetical protein